MKSNKVTKKENKDTKKKTEKVKLNSNYQKKNKNEKYISEEAREVRRFVIILFSIIIVVLAVYGITRVLKKDEKKEEIPVTAGSINYDVVSIGTMLNRSDKEYYVMIYDADEPEAVHYSTIINKYMSKEGSKKIYFCDLGNTFNSSYYVGKDGTSNPSAKSVSELALKELTLIKVKDGKIAEYLEDLDTIKSELGL